MPLNNPRSIKFTTSYQHVDLGSPESESAALRDFMLASTRKVINTLCSTISRHTLFWLDAYGIWMWQGMMSTVETVLLFNSTFLVTPKAVRQLNDRIRFQLLAASMKMAVFWDVASCSVEISRRFWGAYCLPVLMTEAISTSVTSVNFYDTTRHNIPEDKPSSNYRMLSMGEKMNFDPVVSYHHHHGWSIIPWQPRAVSLRGQK
jgi:hypothetical protein